MIQRTEFLRDITTKLWVPASFLLLGGLACNGDRLDGEHRAMEEEVLGSWTWVESSGGYAQQTVGPPFHGNRYIIEFSDGGPYREYENGQVVVRSTYNLVREPVFNYGGTDTLVVRVGGTRFFTLFSPDSAFGVTIRGDTLELLGTRSEAWYHRFRRQSD